MTKVIRFLVQCIDQNTGDVLEESIMNEEVLQKASNSKFGLYHLCKPSV